MTAGTIERRGTRVERYDTLVIGGGQAGLAAGRALATRGHDFLILDAEQRVGDVWRHRWDSLRLFTPAVYSGLPGMPFPAPAWHLPDKDEVADYLERYAERFDLPVRLETRVDALAWSGERFVARTSSGQFEADQVIVATGPFQRPNVPAIAAQLSSEVHQLHSSGYRSPFDLPDGPVLVVGAGNSGAQIALELARFRKVWLAGRDTGHLPRRLLGRDLFAWLWPVLSSARVDTLIGGRVRARAAAGGDPRIGITARMIADAGIVRVGRVTEARAGLPVCDGSPRQPRVVVWSTGFVTDHAWIEPSARAESGLHFVGQRFQRSATSALLGGVGADAEYVVERLTRRAEVATVE